MKRRYVKKTHKPRPDLHQQVTDAIVSDLEAGISPWGKLWDTGGDVRMPIRACDEPYKGVNIVILWGKAMLEGYSCSKWITYHQAQAWGGYVRKGQRGTTIVKSSRWVREETDADGNKVTKSGQYFGTDTVFNLEQTEGIDPKYWPKSKFGALSEDERIHHAEEYFRNVGADIEHGGSQAYYHPASHTIHMPPFESFRDPGSYYSVLSHEHTHWTSKPLERKLGGRFGDEAYAAEELIAELGAAFLCATLGLELKPREDHASYIKSWLKVLNNDKTAIFTAASKASKAVEYMNSRQPDYGTWSDEEEAVA